MSTEARIEKTYTIAMEQYAEWGVDTEAAMKKLATIPISLHCWQGDDVGGFESAHELSGGILATGNYPGKANTAVELRQDLDQALSLIPGTHRLNLHAMYAETGGKKVDRNDLQPEHFDNWIDWAKAKGMGLDFNGTYFSHPKADSGFTLSNADERIRRFWIEHGIACRYIGEHMGRSLGTPCVTNIWIPDGYKDIPVDRCGPRERLMHSLDDILAEAISPEHHIDAVESKLFGIGSESYVVGSHEFYLAYATTNKIALCLDAGHYHPTEVISDKLSAVLTFLDRVLLHVSRPVRWDSDHVVILSDELLAIAREVVFGNYLERTHIGLDFFDASINRVAAWTIGTRCMLKALLIALLEPAQQMRQDELDGNLTRRLAVQEELKTLPFGAVWDYYCTQQQVPVGIAWLDEVHKYETAVTSKRQ